jgi:hypothetical protein
MLDKPTATGADNFSLRYFKPSRFCHPVLHNEALAPREDSPYFGKTSEGWFFCFNLHLSMARRGTSSVRRCHPATRTIKEPAIALCLNS